MKRKALSSMLFFFVSFSLLFNVQSAYSDYCIHREKYSGMVTTSLNFGSYYIGDTGTTCKQATFTNRNCYSQGQCPSYLSCNNVSAQPARTISLSSSPYGSMYSISPSLPVTVASGANQTFTICFDPAQSGYNSGSYDFDIDPEPQGSDSISVSASLVLTPDITTSSPISMDSTAGAQEKPFIVRNRHPSATIAINAIGRKDLVNCAASIVSYPSSIGPGDTEEVRFSVTPSGLGVFSGRLIVKTPGDYYEPVIRFSGSLPLTIRSSDTIFGQRTIGSSYIKTKRVYNDGDSAFTITGVSHSNSRFSSSGWSGTVAVGGYKDITINFSPTAETNYTDTMTISTNINGNNVEVENTGKGVGSEVLFTQGSNFRTDINGESRSTIQLYNASATSKTISSVSGFSDPPFSASYSTTPISPGGTRIINIQYSPTELEQGTVGVTVKVEGIPAETFYFDYESTVDATVPASNTTTTILMFFFLCAIGLYLGIRTRNTTSG